MKKTGSLTMKMFTAMLILFAVSAISMSSASAKNFNPATSSIPTTTVFLTPYRIQGTAGETITINANITDVTDLLSFQIGLWWSNPTVANCTGVSEGGFLSTGNPAGVVLTIPGTINNTAGVVTFWTFGVEGSQYVKSGSGTLTKFTFYMIQTGYSDVHIQSLILIYEDGVTTIPCNTIDYFTVVRGGSTYIVKIEGNPIQTGGEMLGGYTNQSVSGVSQSISSTTYTGLLSFNVTGDNGISSFAYFNVTIPQSLMNCSTADQWMVYLNGTLQGTRTVSQNATCTFIYLAFSYYPSPAVGQPTQMVQIYSTSIVPEFSDVFLAILLVLATFAAALFGKATWSYKTKNLNHVERT